MKSKQKLLLGILLLVVIIGVSLLLQQIPGFKEVGGTFWYISGCIALAMFFSKNKKLLFTVFIITFVSAFYSAIHKHNSFERDSKRISRQFICRKEGIV